LNIVDDNDDSSSELASVIIESEREIDNLQSNNKIENFEWVDDNKYSESNSDDQIKNEDQNLQNFKEFKEELCTWSVDCNVSHTTLSFTYPNF